LPKWWNW